MEDVPRNPAGEFRPELVLGPARRAELIAELEVAPQAIRSAVSGISEANLDVKYRDCTIRQIVQHLADSHARP